MSFFQRKKMHGFFYPFFVVLFLGAFQNPVVWGMEEKPDAFEKDKEVAFRPIPAAVSVIYSGKQPVYINPDAVWHEGARKLVEESHHTLEAAVQGKDPYNVATFQIRAIWEQGPETKLSFSHILFLSKMDLEHLFLNVENPRHIHIPNTEKLIKILKKKDWTKILMI